MGNKVIKHYYDEYACKEASPTIRPEPDKTKTISELSSPEVYQMLDRLRKEIELESLIRELKRNSGQRSTYEQPFKIDTKTPINQLYHFGIKGQRWGVRKSQNGSEGKEKKNIPKSEDHAISREARSRATQGLSNDELRKLNERLQLEATYKNLTTEKMQKSESFVKRAIKTGGEAALSEFSKTVFLGSAKLIVKQVSPEFAEVVFNMKPGAAKAKTAEPQPKQTEPSFSFKFQAKTKTKSKKQKPAQPTYGQPTPGQLRLDAPLVGIKK